MRATSTAWRGAETDFQEDTRRRCETSLRASLNRAAKSIGTPANEAKRAAWTDDQVERLKALWTAGQSAAAIARALGLSGKNAVIGKVNRLGLTREKTTPWTPAKTAQLKTLWRENWSPVRLAEHFGVSASAVRSKARDMGLFRGKPQASAPRPAKASVKTAPTPPARSAPQPHHIPFARLTAKTCRWPYGGEEDVTEMRFCGCEAEDGAAYCSIHEAKARKPRAFK